MKSKILMLISIFSTSLFSFNTFSFESKVCLNPIKTICTNTKTQRTAREKYIQSIQKEISIEAKKNAAPRIAKMQINLREKSFIKRGVEALKITNQETMKVSKSKIIGIESVVKDLTNVLMVKNYMRQAVDQSSFNQTTRTKFKKIIDSVQVGSFGDFLEKYESEDSFFAQLSNPCGSDGMVANAFATTLNKEKYVLICPGFLISLSQTANKKERLNTILHTISHEMGHHLDKSLKDNDDVYKPYLSCISRNYSQQLVVSESDQRFCKKKAENQSQCRMKITMSHANEMIADQWGIKVLAIHAKAEGYSVSQADSLLVNSWANICGSEDKGGHPSGDFRIGTLLRANLEISDYLSCNNTLLKKPACGFEGETRL